MKAQRLLLLAIALSAVFSVPAFALSPPTGQSSCSYPSSMGLHKENDPALCRPFVGQVTGGMLSRLVGLPPFSPGVDIYLAVWSEALGVNTIWMITQGDQIMPFPAGFTPWRAGTSGNLDEMVFGIQIPIAALPAGTYFLYLAATPASANNLNLYYLWSTHFVVPFAWQQVGGQVSSSAAESEDPTMMILNGTPAVGYRHQSFSTDLNVWNGATWGTSEPDPTSNQTNGSIYGTPAFCSNGAAIYMAYSHAGDSTSGGASFYDRIFTYRWDPQAHWVIQNGGNEVSNPYVAPSGADAYEPSISCVPSGNPVVAWIEANGAAPGNDDAWIAEVSSTDVKRSSPLSRNNNAGLYPTDVRTLGVLADGSGNKYLAQWEQNETDQDRTDLYVTMYGGGGFTPLGGAIADDYDFNTLSAPSLAMSGTVLYVAYSRANPLDHTKHIYVKKYDGGWTVLGGGPVSAFPQTNGASDHYDSGNPNLLFANGNLYLTWEESSVYEGAFIFVARWDEALGEWLIIGDRLNLDQTRSAQDPSIAYSAGDAYLYVAFEEMVSGWPQIFVKRTLLPQNVTPY
jgi:hypothetical protein